MAGLPAEAGFAIDLARAQPVRAQPVQIPAGANGWVLEHWRASAQLLHQRPMPADQRRRISLLEPIRPALVLGSTSLGPAAGTAVSTAAGTSESEYDIVRRRSGGGLVWLEPAESTWLDVFVPAGDELSCTDIARSFEWLGSAIAEAFVSLGAAAKVHQGEFEPGPGDGLICMGSLGHGEVVVEAADASRARKLVGISQRRNRLGSRFQCVWYKNLVLGAIEQVAKAQDCAAAKDRACGWASLGTSFASNSSSKITQRVVAHLAAV